MSGRHNPAVTLNAVPVGFDHKAKLRIGRVPYVMGPDLDALRDEHRGVHLVRTRTGEYTEVIARTDADLPGDVLEVEAGEVPHIVAGLVREWLLDHLLGLKRPVMLRHHRVMLISNKDTDDLLHTSAPNGVKLPAWLGVRVAYTFDDRVVVRADGHRDVVLVCEARSRIFIDAPVSDLLERHMNVTGLYVRRNSSQSDARLMPRRELVGRIREVDGSDLRLDDHIDDVEMIAAKEAFLEPRAEVLERVLRVVEPHCWSDIVTKLSRKRATVASGPDRLKRMATMFEYLAKQKPLLAPGLAVDFGSMISVRRDRFPPSETIEKPELIFDLGGRKTDRWNQRGLDTHGPSDRYQFTPKQLNIAVICQKAKEGRVETFVERLLSGLPGKVGFLQRFSLERPNLKQLFTSRTASAKDYLIACNEALDWITDKGKTWNLVLVQIDDGMAALNGDDNPYLVTKAFFLRHGAAVQDVELETMEQSPEQLVYSLNNIGLASYAKLGGIPWLLPADQKVAHELVSGLGSYQANTSRMGPKRRFVGITTVFTGDGRYLLGSRTRAVPFEQYTEELLKAIQRAVDEVREQQNWRPDDPVRLVFHAFKPMKNAEVCAVQKLMEGLGLAHAKYAFVHVVDAHPFLLFDEEQRGANAPGGSKKGVMAPPRGLCLRLSRHEALLALKGANEVKLASDGLPRPVILRLHRNSTFDDLVYLSRQVFAFSCHSWRSFFPAPMPITIGYSEMMAEKLRLLQDVDGWSEDAIGGLIGRTRWFL